MSEFDKIHRLTPFEEYMFWDDTPAFPMHSWQKLRFSGKIDIEVFQEAYAEALIRHPLMNARIVMHWGKPYWVFSKIPPQVVLLENNEPDGSLPYPNIRETNGCRVFCRYLESKDGKPQTEIGIMVHHSVSDGIGCQLFFEDIFLNYARRKGVQVLPDQYPPVAEDSLALRHDPGVTWGRYFRLLSHGTKPTWDLVLHRTEGLLPLFRASRRNVPKCSNLTFDFNLTQEESALFRQKAKRCGVTMNDLILRAFFLGTADFKKKFYPQTKKWIRLAMPINMRFPEYPGLFATNVVSMVFLDRKLKQISESDEFLAKLHQETEWIKRTDQGLTLLENLKGCRNFPRGIKLVLSGNKCWSTTVVSNLGILFKNTPLPKTEDGRLIVGDTVLESFFGVPPFRAKTFTGWGIWTYAGRLGMAMRYDERYLTEEQIRFSYEACRNRLYESFQD